MNVRSKSFMSRPGSREGAGNVRNHACEPGFGLSLRTGSGFDEGDGSGSTGSLSRPKINSTILVLDHIGDIDSRKLSQSLQRHRFQFSEAT